MSQGNPTEHEIDIYAYEVNLNGGDQSKAWRKVFPDSKAKQEVIHKSASVMHSLPNVQVRVAEVCQIIADKAKEVFDEAADNAVMSKQEAMEGLTKFARVKMTDVADFKNVDMGQDKDGNDVFQTVWTIKDSEDMDPEIAACIKSVKATNKGPEIELYDGMAARKQLADLQGWNKPTGIDLTVKKDLSDLTDEELVEEMAKHGIEPEKT
jgi:phage terminase small subunit